MGKNEILEQALHLKASEKFLIIEELIKSLDNPDSEIDKAWEEEAVKRLEAYREGKLESVDMEEVFGDDAS